MTRHRSGARPPRLTTEKKRITADWSAIFPAFHVYRPLWLLRRFGPLVQGICLERDSSGVTYLPTLHLHNLCSRADVLTLTMSQPLGSARTGAPERLPVRAHAERFRDAATRLATQSPLPLGRAPTTEEVHAAYARGFAQNPGVALFKDAALFAAWNGEAARVDALIAQAARAAGGWPASFFGNAQSLTGWIDGIRRLAANRDELLRTAEEQEKTLGLGAIPIVPLGG